MDTSADHPEVEPTETVSDPLSAPLPQPNDSPSTPPLQCNSLNPSSKPQSPSVFVSLKSSTHDLDSKKTSITGNSLIVDRIIERGQIMGNKVTNYRMMQKAQKVGEMREIPEINPTSKKIMEAKIQSALENASSPANATKFSKQASEPMLSKYFKQREETIKDSEKSQLNLNMRKDKKKSGKKAAKPVEEENKHVSILDSPLPPEMFKPKPKIIQKKQALIEPEDSMKDVIERTKAWHERKGKKLEESMKIKSIKDMQECTFKPQLSLKNEYNASGNMITKHYNEGKMKRLGRKDLNLRSEFLTEAEVFSCKYAQLSPTPFIVKRDLGYDHDDFIKRARPMADYRQFIDGALVGN